MTDYETIEGSDPEPLVEHEPRLIEASDGGTIKVMMSEIGDGVFVAWDICHRCKLHVAQCSCVGAPTEPPHITHWRDERFEKELNGRPKLDIAQTLNLVKQLREAGWLVEQPKTSDPAIERVRSQHGLRPIENVPLPTVVPGDPEQGGSDEPGSPDDYDETCKFPDCDVKLDDGEGWDGYCGHHADKVYAHQESQDPASDIEHECDEECPLYDPAAEALAEIQHAGEQIAAIRQAARDNGFDPGF